METVVTVGYVVVLFQPPWTRWWRSDAVETLWWAMWATSCWLGSVLQGIPLMFCTTPPPPFICPRPPPPQPPSIYLPFFCSFHPHPPLKAFLSQCKCSLLIPQLYPVHRVMYVHNTVHIITLKGIDKNPSSPLPQILNMFVGESMYIVNAAPVNATLLRHA